MADVTAQRGDEGDWGTKGVWTVARTGWTCDSLELPNRGNMPGLSRIPPRIYSCSLVWSHHFQRMLYQINDVEGRGNIEIHPGNWAGDPAMGLYSNVRGCALLGKGYGVLKDHPGQIAILNSGLMVDQFMVEMRAEPFTLDIRAAQNPSAGLPGQP